MHLLNETLIPESYIDGGLNGRFSATVLFIDISGFTPLTETLFQYHQQGAEILSALLNEIFGEMVHQVNRRRGFIPMFAGDGFFAIFPGDLAETAAFAWQTAVAIQHYFQSARGPFSLFVTPYGVFEIGVKIGMAAGEVEWGIVYNDHQATCFFHGDSLYNSTDAEQTAVTGDLIAHESLLPYLPSDYEAWSADVPTFHKIVPQRHILPAPPTPQKTLPLPLPAKLSMFLRNQAAPDPVLPDFRLICPVFISFQGSHPDWVQCVQQAMTLAVQYGGAFSRLEFGDKGDLMLFWFGAPVSHENNVERAIKFLLALQRETAVPWRAGLTYDLVWAGIRGGQAYREYGCIGDALNTAARIVYRADWGQIWLSEAAARELPPCYRLENLGNFRFKGKQECQPLLRLSGVCAPPETAVLSEMVGRQAEIAECLAAIAPIFNGRFAGAVTIQGEAGIGKSCLAAALRRQLAECVSWFTCPADDILNESFNPFQTMLAAWSRQSVAADAAENWRQFIESFQKLVTDLSLVTDERAPAIYAELHRTKNILAELAGIVLHNGGDFLDPQLRFENHLLTLTAFFQAQALLRPLVVYVEDTHWLDDETWRYLAEFHRRFADFPVALLLTGRPGGALNNRYKTETAVLSTVLNLAPFTETEMQALARQTLGRPVTLAVLSLLQLQSGGNPFFALQLLLELRQQDLFVQVDEGETAVFTLTHAEQHVVPRTLNALLTARLDRLSAAVKSIVQTASVLGQRFSLAVLAAMLPHEPDLFAKIEQAAGQEIWQIHADRQIHFYHALLRDVAYTMQPQSQRRQIHHLAAAALETLYTAELAAHYREIAYHYHAAFENGMLSARTLARRYLRLAGEQAAKLYENETAVTYFSQALALSVRDDKKFPILLAREAVYHLQGQRDLQAQDIAVLTRIAQEQQDKAMMAAAALRRARYAEALGDYALSGAHAQAAFSYARTPNQAAEACLQGGLALVSQGEYEEGARQLSEALLLARQTEQPFLQSKALINLGKTAVRQGSFQESIPYYHEALSLCQKTGDRQMEGAVLNDLGAVALYQEDFQTAVIHYNAALATAQEIGDRRTESQALNNLGGIAAAHYQFVEARANFSRDLQISHEIGDIDGEGQALGNLGYVEVILGNYAQAETYIRQDVAIARQTGNRPSEVMALTLLGWCANAQAKWEEAVTHFEQGRQLAQMIGDPVMELYCLGGLGNAYVGLAQPEEGANLLQQAVVGYRGLHMEAFALEALAGWVRARLAQGKAAETRPAVAELLSHLQTVGPFDGADTPLLILWTCCRALWANQDGRFEQILALTVKVLETAVSHIPDEATRHSFLQNVSWHREIMLAYNEHMFYN
jgi:class 3 adenylate cyclase/tetratricopeptide (TPR) repeat protein